MTRGAISRALLGAVVLACALAVSADPLAAQEAAPSPSPAPSPTAATGEASAAANQQQPVVEEITVTAQKRKEDIQDVPVSVSVYDAEQLQTLTTGGGDVLSLSGRVPSLTLESSFGRAFPRFYIRGLGNTDFDLNASQPVSMLVDDVVLENPVVKGMPLWDIDHVEVLRGPQGTLFGRNTPAGVVKFDTRKPADSFDGYTQVSYGTYNNVDAQAAVGGKISDTLSGRVSVLYQTQDDWVANKFTGNQHALGGYDEKAARAQLLWKPSETFDALLNLHGWELDGTARIFRANILKKGTNDLVPGFRQDTVYQDGLNDQWVHSHGGALKMNWELGPATLTSVTGYETLDMYSRGDIDGGFGAGAGSGPGFIPFSSESADGIPNLDQWTEELRLASHSGGRWDYLLGFFWFDEKLKVDSFSYDSLNHNVQNGFAFQNQTDKSWALFGSLDFRPTERWTLKGGLRYTSDKKDFAAERPQPTFQTPTVAPITANTDAGLLTGDFSAAYKVSETVNVYGRVGTGFRAPSIQGRILFCPDFQGGTNPATNCVDVAHEEKIVSAEIGVKTELLDRKLRLNLDTYDYRMKGQQIVAVGGKYNTATLLNADRTDGYGVEADIEALPSSKWLITLGTSYNHTRIDDPNLVVAVCGGGCTMLDPVSGPIGSQVAHVDGNPLPHAPQWIVDGAIDFRQPIGSSLLDASVDWAYSSTKNFFLYESKEFRSDSFELGARIGWMFAETKYELALFGHNLANRVIVQNGIDFDNLTGMTNEPRQVGIQFLAHF